MKTIKWGGIAAALALFVCSLPTFAQESGALIDALVKKGVITDQEGEEIRASEEKDWSESPASKINISSFIKGITLYGDLRLRYEYRDGTTNAHELDSSGNPYTAGPDNETRNRWRYRLRVGIKGDLMDNFFFGLRLSSAGSNQRSGNVTFGTSGGSPGTNIQGNGGPFSHGNGVGWDQLYLGWKPTEWVTLTAGQMPNPFYTTNLIWDDNLSPTGFAEQFSHKWFDDKDVEVFANFGQFLYNSANYSDPAQAPATLPANSNSQTDAFMLEEQVGAKAKYTIFKEEFQSKVALGIMTYSGTESGNTAITAPVTAPGAQPVGFGGPYIGSTDMSNNYGINDLAVVEVPFETSFKAGIPMKLFGDFAYNLSGGDRAQAAADAVAQANAHGIGANNNTAQIGTAAALASPTTQALLGNFKSDNKAYQIGMQFNDLKKKGDWMTKVYWEHTEYFAVDPNLDDADIFDARQNMEGIVFKASYNLTDALTFTGQFANASRINKNLGAPGTGQDLNIQPNDYRLVQADLVWKF